MSLTSFLRACEADRQIDATHVLCVSGENVFASYVRKPYRMDTLRLMFSMTKSISSLAVGIARDMGLVDLNERIFDIFRDERPDFPHENLPKITVRHLLTMSAGMHDNTYERLYSEPDWVRAFLAQDFPHEPGTFYRYSTHGSHMLSALITKKTGCTMEDFLNEHLFYPMGIYEAQWEKSPEGLTAGGMGLSLYPRSAAKIVQMLLNRGVYQGKRVISEEYLDMAASRQIFKEEDAGVYKGDGYGFQFHIGKGGCFRMDGAFGQLCLIDPVKKLGVVVFSCQSKMERLLELVYTHLMEAEPDWETEAQEEEKETEERSGAACFEGKCSIVDRVSVIRQAEIVRRADGGYSLQVETADGAHSVHFVPGLETAGRTGWYKDIEWHEQEYVCRAAMRDNCLQMTVWWIETPCVCLYRIEKTDGGIRLEPEIRGLIGR